MLLRSTKAGEARPTRARFSLWSVSPALIHRKWIAGAVVLALLTGFSPSAVSAQAVPPEVHWSSFDTEHFTVTFSEGLEPLARRAGERAELAYTMLSSAMLPPPDQRIELVVTDHVDSSNGSAQPFPRNRIIAFAQPPISEPSLSLHDDWLEQLIIHELVHIFHLDYAEGVWPHLRPVFGRSPYLFPAIFSPGWLVEGLATYYESALTEGGRVRGSTYQMILRAAVLEDEFFGIDAASLDPITWPGGTSRYIYGAFFLDHLARRYGAGKLPELLRELGGEIIPYRIDAAARRALGTSLSAEWTVWEDSLRMAATTLADSLASEGLTQPELLTFEGRSASHPRYSPDGSSLAYSASTGRAETDLRLLRSDGSVESLAPRSSLGAADWLPGGGLLYAQIDFDGRTRMLSDLYLLSAGGEETRLTEDARLWEADAHPVEPIAVAVRSENGTNVLTLVDLRSGGVSDLTAPTLDVYWAAPGWSPDGERIAVSRWSGGFYDVVVLDRSGRVVETVTTDRAIDSSPSWSADGRYILFSSDRTGIANIFAFDTTDRSLAQVTSVVTGAFQPDVSPDQAWIAFSYYRAHGYHIARIPFDRSAWRPVPRAPGAVEGLAPPIEVASPDGTGPVRDYSARRTLGPTTWTPLLTDQTGFGTGIGLAVGGEDVVQRHEWSAAILGYPSGEVLEGAATYTYRGLGNPVIDFRVSEEWEQRLGRPAPGASLAPVRLRDRGVEARSSWLWRSWRAATSVEAGTELSDLRQRWRDEELAEAPLRDYPLDLGAFVGTAYSTRRGYALSLGIQDGFLLGTRLEARRYLAEPEWLGARGYWRSTSRGQLFRGLDWFGYAPSVLAARVNFGVESDAASSGFRLGGAGGEDPIGTSVSTSYPVRGYRTDTQRGDRVVSASVEYRFPVALIERGFRLFPLGVTSLWGDVFVDSGAAWCASDCGGLLEAPRTSPAPLISVGAEAILDLRIGYLSSLPLRGGVAFALRHGQNVPQLYLRIGPSF